MRRISALLFLIAIGIAAYAIPQTKSYIDRWSKFSFCERTITYKIGTIDPNFNITQEQLKKDIQTAADMWNKKIDRDLFIYDEKAKLTINLIYDDRQVSIAQINTQKNIVNKEKTDYEITLEKFENEKIKVEQTMDKLNEDIAYWNAKGGAPKDVYKTLINKQKEVQNEIDRINTLTKKINGAVDNVNAQIDNLNNEVNGFNKLLKSLPEEGLFIGAKNKIEIYIYDDQEGFIHTVAHELGHALGLEHVDEEGSLMHPVSSEDSKFTQADQQLLDSFCEEKSTFNLVRNDFKTIIQMLYSKINNVLPLTT